MNHLEKENYCIIMAGGIGSRFWPMSRSNHPKQFHDVLGTGQSLIQMTYQRFMGICPKENILIVTNQAYRDLVLDQLEGIHPDQILCEPSRKNTAPCIAYASFKIKERTPNANIIVAPSDHIIVKEIAFYDTVKKALEFSKNKPSLVTLGITPNRPDTGYGYIQADQGAQQDHSSVYPVKQFTEKPDLKTAEEFLNSGDFYWNSGIFIWRLENILQAFSQYLPDLYALFEKGAPFYNSSEEMNFIQEVYPQCEDISIDYGIMEKAGNTFVIPSDIGWSDLGTWGSLYTHIPHDDQQNAFVGGKLKAYETEGCMVYLPKDQLAVIRGLKDYIVVQSSNALLICPKQEEQQIKQYVKALSEEKDGKYT